MRPIHAILAAVLAALVPAGPVAAATPEEILVQVRAAYEIRAFAVDMAEQCPAEFAAHEVLALKIGAADWERTLIEQTRSMIRSANPKSSTPALQAMSDDAYANEVAGSANAIHAGWLDAAKKAWPKMGPEGCADPAIRPWIDRAVGFARLHFYDIALKHGRIPDFPCVPPADAAAFRDDVNAEYQDIEKAYPADAAGVRGALTRDPPPTCDAYQSLPVHARELAVIRAFNQASQARRSGARIQRPQDASPLFDPLIAWRLQKGASPKPDENAVRHACAATDASKGHLTPDLPEFKVPGRAAEAVRARYSLLVMGDGTLAIAVSPAEPKPIVRAGFIDDVRSRRVLATTAGGEPVQEAGGGSPVTRFRFSKADTATLRARLAAGERVFPFIEIDGQILATEDTCSFDPAAFLKLWDWAAAKGRVGDPSIR